MMKKSALKNRIKSLFCKYKTTIFVVALSLQLAIGLTMYFLFGRISPNDNIFVPKEGSVAYLVNKNPKFSVDFGNVEQPDKQWVRFEAQTSANNPFEKEKGNIFTKIAKLFQKKERYGIEMSLVGVDLTGENLEKYGDEVVLVADVIGTDSIKTSTELIDVGREIGVYEDQEVPVSKQTVLNKDVANGVDLEYQIMKGLGLKEEIIIRDLEAYQDSCKVKECSLPVNEFVFDLKMDSDVELKEGWFTIDGQSTSTYYFVDSKGRYLAHFLPNFAIDDINSKTFDVKLKVEEGENDNYRAKVTVSLEWLLSSERVFPVRIDPSIVHDDTTDFSGGIFNGVESVTGPKIQIEQPTSAFNCTGGTVTMDGVYKIHTFTASGDFVCTGSGDVAVLVVGGGGGGGSGGLVNSGGGAGGMVYDSTFVISEGSFSVTVGAGGVAGSNGGDSEFSTITAYGGGAGKAPTANGGNGGCGGGAAAWNSTASGGIGSQGYNGGGTGASPAYNGGGGGGAGAAGTTGGYKTAGNGGTGAYSSISGTSVCYAGGGASSGRTTSGSPGACGGGGTVGNAGTNGLGGGGGGGATGGGNGGTGGSGIVIIRYKPTEAEEGNIFGEYTSSSMDMGSSMSEATLSWIPSGVNTGDGETPYSTTGLVAQWNFNETSGTTAVSGGSCGTSCNGTLTSMTTTGQDAAVGTGWTADNRRWGSGAVMFDGVDDYISVPNNAYLNLETNITLEAWVNLNKGSSSYPAIIAKSNSIWEDGYGLYFEDGYFRFWVFSGTNSAWPEGLSKGYNEWQHIVGTYDGSYAKLYINGVLQDSVAFSESITNTSTALTIGKEGYGSGGDFWNGNIDLVRIYSRALPDSEVLSNYQAGNIEFQYRVSTDNSTWSNWTSYGDGGIALDGVDDYISVGDVDSFDALTELSVCTWVKHDTISDDDFILTKIDNIAWEGFMLLKDDIGQETGRTDMYKVYISGTAYIEGASNSAVADKWTHVCTTFKANDATGLHLYVNGVEDANSPVSTVGTMGIASGTNILSIGRYEPGTQNYFDGNIDNIQVYSRVLSASEIVSNYSTSDGETPYSSDSMFAFWKMNELSGTTASAIGSCGASCNGTLTNFTDTSGRDVKESSGWSSKSKRGSDSLWESFDNPYLYDTDTTGLLGYWPMEETSGTSVADVVGSNTGTATGTTIVDGPYGKARNFNGSSDYLSVASVSGLSLGNTVFSTEMWIKPTATPTTRQWPLLLGDASAGNLHISYNTSGTISLGVWNGGECSVTPVVGAWNHVAFTFDGTTGRCYLDGALKSTTAMTFNLSSTALKIAQAQVSEAYFNGSIDEIRISSIVRTEDEIQANYFTGTQISKVIQTNSDSIIKIGGDYSKKISAGMQNVDRYTVGLWHLDERGGSGAYIKDSGNSGNHLTPTGTSYLNSGKIEGARSFNGSSDYLSLASVSGLSLGNTPFSIEMWIKPTATPTTRQWPLLLGGASAGNFHILHQSDGGIYLGAWDVGNCKITPVVGAWNHVAFTFDGTTGRCYLDGVLKSTTAMTFNFSSMALKIAQAQISEAYFNGSVDEIRISSGARTTNEIANAYRLGKDGFVNTIIEEKDLSSATTLPIYVAGDRPGSYLNTIWGETEYSNYQPDTNTVGLWNFDEGGEGSTYIDQSREGNSGITSYYGMRYGILSSNLTMIMNQWNGVANNYEMDITCPGGDSFCQIVTLEGETLSPTSINYGVAAQDVSSTLYIMYSPSLSGQSITAYANNSNNFIAVRYNSGWQYDNNSTWVSFTPKTYNILVAKALWGTLVTQLDYPAPADGKMGDGLDFSGSDQVTILDDNSLDFSSSFTVEAWIKPDSLPSVSESGGGIVTKGWYGETSTYNHNFWLSLCYDASWAGNTGAGYSFGFEVAAGSNYYATVNESLELNSWHHLTGVFDDDEDELRLYHNGQLVKVTTGVTVTPNTQAMDLTIGSMMTNYVSYFDGIIDGVRISNIARNPEDIRQVYEMESRTHPVQIDFGASLVSGNLITGSGDTSFNIDATVYGLDELGSGLYKDEKVIIKENYDGTEYIAQGTVSAITASTGAVTVSSWDTGSTFPSGGYTVNADVFKWQREYIPIKNRTINTQVNAINLLTLNITNGDEGRNLWIDDLRSTSGYLSDDTGEELTFPSSGQYFQYKAIFNTWDIDATFYISQVQLDYGTDGPTMDQVMRHGKWFNSSGEKQPFWWVNMP